MKTKKSLEQNFFILGFLKTITASDLKIQVWHEAQRIIQSLHLLLLSNSPFFFWKFSAGFVLQKNQCFSCIVYISLKSSLAVLIFLADII